MSYLFYSEATSRILDRQGLAQYIEKLVVDTHLKKQVSALPKMVQVVAQNMISDTVHDFPCTFYCEQFKTGSYLRLTKWEVSTQSKKFQIIVNEAQYLGGAGVQVTHGKKWETDRIKNIVSSSIVSSEFAVISEPSLRRKIKTKPLKNNVLLFPDNDEEERPMKHHKPASDVTD